MKVTLAPGQTDVSEKDLGELQRQLESATKTLKEYALAREAAEKQVVALQHEIDAQIQRMKVRAPDGTAWKMNGYVVDSKYEQNG